MNPDLSRRRFIKGVIASSTAAASSSAWYSAAASDRPSGAVERLVTLNVNGRKRPVDVLPQETLAHTLRYKLGLTGTKLGCNRGECGACTVHLNGQPIRSCSLPVSAAADAEVTTIEGLANEDQLHPVQQAWIAEQVPQCGYCQSGQIMSAAALLAGNPNPSDAEITRAMNGNICRCGTYQRIRKAIKRAAGSMSVAGVGQFDPKEVRNG